MRLPRFKAVCMSVGALNVLLAGSLFAKGLGPSMAEFQVPAAVVASPHYIDALTWVYTHMIVLGLVIMVVGWYADSPRFKQAFARCMLGAHTVYAYLDFRSSDSALGNGLYQGPASVIPALVCVFMMLCFAYLSFYRPATETL